MDRPIMNARINLQLGTSIMRSITTHENTPTTITAFPLDFILHFPTPESRNKVLSS
uniref:Uncharacterized protein n=1 Tax=Arundo donax TaxID=35708 RepID=A0A0A9EPH3_ARUDO